MRQIVSENCNVICEDNGKKMTGEVISFKEKDFLSVSIDRQIKLNMKWNGKIYEGKMANLTFTSYGPDITNIKQGRI